MAGQQSKIYLGLLNGIAKRQYYGNEEFTDDFLKSELFPESSEDEFQSVLRKFKNLLKSLVSADMDFNQLEAFLTSHKKKRDGGLTEEQAAAFTKFWKNNKTKIHESVISQSSWNNTLKSMSWRIDVKGQAKNIEQINTPTAIVELQITNTHGKKEGTDIVRFEMDEEKLGHVMRSLEEIEQQIQSHVS
ncbi:COMM domain-containing protein 1-like [Anneissia japonica]|uniref:COMM domain-containing protein 1-like n=1 Tax=Anneissia japonica TaxID=1529436 RepID=UPI0014259478|nr:COMM domain-containing protein 1-like [Anneissia japonica]